jgi:hypothetical protein
MIGAVEQTIRNLQGADFEPEREEKSRLAGLILYALAAIGGGAFVGAGYRAYRALEAIAG